MGGNLGRTRRPGKETKSHRTENAFWDHTLMAGITSKEI